MTFDGERGDRVAEVRDGVITIHRVPQQGERMVVHIAERDIAMCVRGWSGGWLIVELEEDDSLTAIRWVDGDTYYADWIEEANREGVPVDVPLERLMNGNYRVRGIEEVIR